MEWDKVQYTNFEEGYFIYVSSTQYSFLDIFIFLFSSN